MPATPRESSYRRIWAIVKRIPRGKVATYGQVAALAGLPKQARLAGYALHNTPPRTTLPWHRVLNAQGRISLPQPQAREQRRRLEAEGVVFLGGRVDLARHRWQAGNAAPVLD
jgi:methylated-DNA-protein-cysteine methyltransferase related protein